MTDVGSLAAVIDHTLLRPEATRADVDRLCGEALELETYGVCVFPSHVGTARDILKGRGVRISAVVAFPFGCTFLETKESEARSAASAGADEIDVVINLSELKSGNDRAVQTEMKQLMEDGRELGLVMKFIIEMTYLDGEERRRVVDIANRVGVDFIKTSTGFAPAGAKEEDVRFLRQHLTPGIRIKAAGGIRTREQAHALIEAGASRLGCSRSVEILEEDA